MACCCQSPEVETPPSPKEKVSKGDIPKLEIIDHADDRNFPGKEVYEDEEGIEMFFDALSSHFSSAVGSLSYAPTATMRQSAIGSKRVSILSPQTLLSPRNLSLVLEDSHEEEEKGHKSKKHVRASVVQVTSKLQQRTSGTQGQGYPGELTQEELDACLKFRDELKVRDPALKEIVYMNTPVEEESFALCRVLRGMDFDPNVAFAKFEEKNVNELWEEAKKEEFYQDFEAHFRCPLSVFIKLFPILSAGVAKNGCVLMYVKAGEIDIDGIECIADLPTITPYVWHILHEKSKRAMKREIELHNSASTTVLAEKIAVVDMKGVPSALFGSDGMEFLKAAAKGSACFPEILNRAYVVNVSMAFTMVWAVLKYFLDPRTIRKIGFFSNANKAKKDLLNYVPAEELLSDFGGDGTSHQDLLATRQEEYGDYGRYVVECMQVSKRESTVSFSLAKGESIADVTIYSKSDDGAIYTLKSNGKVIAGPVDVNRSAAKNVDNKNKPHYSVPIPVSNKAVGPAEITVLAFGDSGNFLLAVSIS